MVQSSTIAERLVQGQSDQAVRALVGSRPETVAMYVIGIEKELLDAVSMPNFMQALSQGLVAGKTDNPHFVTLLINSNVFFTV